MLKKFLKIIFCGVFGINLFFSFININTVTTFADESTTTTTVTVTEPIPGMECPPKAGAGTGITNKQYECTIKPGFGSVMDLLAGVIKYATFIVILLGVLVLVISGVRMSVEGKKEEAIKHFKRVLMGLVLLFLVGFILNTVAPWIYK